MKKFEIRATCEFQRTLSGYVTIYAEDENDARSKFGIIGTAEWMDQHFIGEGYPCDVRIEEVQEMQGESK